MRNFGIIRLRDGLGGAPAIDKDGTIYINIMQGEAGVCAFGSSKIIDSND